MWKNVFKIIAVFIIGTVGGIFADQILWPYFIERPLFFQYRLEQAPVYLTKTEQVVIEENTVLQDAVDKVQQTVIGIRSRTATGKIVEGSGLIVSADGLVVTFSDLVPQGAATFIFLDDRSPSFQVLKRDQKANLVLLKLEESNLTTSGFAGMDKLRLGERVFLVGAVLQKDAKGKITLEKSANEGVVKIFTASLIETNILEKPALYASPLFNISGEVLGLNIIGADGAVTTIPISKIRPFIGL